VWRAPDALPVKRGGGIVFLPWETAILQSPDSHARSAIGILLTYLRQQNKHF
jgi:hypothetical protein